MHWCLQVCQPFLASQAGPPPPSAVLFVQALVHSWMPCHPGASCLQATAFLVAVASFSWDKLADRAQVRLVIRWGWAWRDVCVHIASCIA
jgi:hypothetical protein